MDSSFNRFNLVNRIGAAVALVVSAITYLLTIEPTASLWDCGEFIASSYKLEVGHAPGNPMFQLIARFFTLFGDNMHAAVIVNSMSALCSAFTIFFLYLTIVWFVRRMIPAKEEYSVPDIVAIVGSGLAGSLAYCFSDTFWFSAVEGEVYAMSSLFTALVFWLMTVWYDRADKPHSNKWIVLIAFLMGLSIGVHLLNLLAIPALVFMYYYRRREDKPFTFGEFLKIFLVGTVILGLILFFIIPFVPKFAAYTDLFFVNVLGLPVNSGAAFFVLALLALCFRGLFVTLKKEKVFANTVLLCFTTIIIGFSVFSLDVIRSCAKTPTNETQPDNAFSLVRYLSREQYGSSPLLYGQYYDADYDVKTTSYWALVHGKYRKVTGPMTPEYKVSGKMLFPRMWSGGDRKGEEFYQLYTDGKKRKPTMGENLVFFFDYQLNWMYWRYFMWNFVGRQNQIHSPSPGNIFHGNWESGIAFIDNVILGDQKNAPSVLKEDKGKNHYYFLPLILGLLGLCFQFDKDKRGCWLNFLMFFMTGIAIVLYLNQPPYQVRERDYAYAGSFYFFSVWIGLAVAALCRFAEKAFKGRGSVVYSSAISVLCLFVPAIMAQQNWDDHDRSNRRTSVEMASNYLNSVGRNGILITHGDNDTFPLWYAQEVENIRPDIRICNTSLLGTDWYIDQMKWACNESAPLPVTVPLDQYLYGVNEWTPIVDNGNGKEMSIHDVMKIFKHPRAKVSMSGGKKVDYIPARRISVPVNRENVLKYGILDAKYADLIPDKIVLEIPKDKEYVTKPELFLLDFLSGYQWDRPLNMLNQGGDLNIGIKDYLEFEGYSYKFIPIRNHINTSSAEIGFVDEDALYRRMKETYKWDAMAADDYFVDYQNVYTQMGVISVRSMFLCCANAFFKAGDREKAVEMLDACIYYTKNFPLESIPLDLSGGDYVVVNIISAYYRFGEAEKAKYVGVALGQSLLEAAQFYLEFYEWAKDDFEMVANYIYYLGNELKNGGDVKLAEELITSLDGMMKAVSNPS